MTNLFADFPANLPDELFTTLLEAADMRTQRIVSHGHASPGKSSATSSSADCRS